MQTFASRSNFRLPNLLMNMAVPVNFFQRDLAVGGFFKVGAVGAAADTGGPAGFLLTTAAAAAALAALAALAAVVPLVVGVAKAGGDVAGNTAVEAVGCECANTDEVGKRYKIVQTISFLHFLN